MDRAQQEVIAKQLITADPGYMLGSHLFGLIFDALFIGVIICQTTHWLPNAREDKVTVRLLVCIAVSAALFTTVFAWAKYMIDFVYDFGVSYLQFMDLRLLGAWGLMQVCTTVPVQLLFVERAVKVNGNSKFILGASILMSSLTFASGLSVFILTRGHTLIDATHRIKVMFQVWPSVCSITHLFNTGTIIFGLLRARAPSESSQKLIKRLIRGCLEAQIPGTAFAFVGMVVICNNVASPLIPFLLLTHAKVYLIGALAMVNARHTWRKEGLVPSSHGSNGSNEKVLTSNGSTSGISSNAWPTTPTTPAQAWGLEVEMGLTEDEDAIKRDEDGQKVIGERGSSLHSLHRLSLLGKGDNN